MGAYLLTRARFYVFFRHVRSSRLSLLRSTTKQLRMKRVKKRKTQNLKEEEEKREEEKLAPADDGCEADDMAIASSPPCVGMP